MERFSTGKSDNQRRTRLPLVNVMVNSRAYTIACDEGEEEHLRDLAKHVDGKVRELLETVGQVGDLKLLLMAALLITDDYFDAVHRLESRAKEFDDLSSASADAKTRIGSVETRAAAVLEAAKKRVGDIAARLAEA
jgi:cell division protein ZapA